MEIEEVSSDKNYQIFYQAPLKKRRLNEIKDESTA